MEFNSQKYTGSAARCQISKIAKNAKSLNVAGHYLLTLGSIFEFLVFRQILIKTKRVKNQGCQIWTKVPKNQFDFVDFGENVLFCFVFIFIPFFPTTRFENNSSKNTSAPECIHK